MRAALILLVGLLALLWVLAVSAVRAEGVGGDAGVEEVEAEEGQSAVRQVVVEGMSYSPKELVVKKGDVVEWVNRDLVPHSVTETGGKFDSGLIKAGKSWRLRFEDAGRVEYRCTLHPMMGGVVLVK